MPPVESTPSGVRLHLRIQPRASQTELAGLHGGALKIRVAAPPVDGAANDALLRFLAGLLEVPRAAVSIEHGRVGRLKTVLISGRGLGEVCHRLGLRAPAS